MISSVIGAIQSVTPYQKLDRDLTIPPVEVFPADKGKDIGVTIFPKPILDIPDVDSIPATERENNVIIENPPYIPKSIIDIFPEHVNEGETIIRMDGGFEGASKSIPDKAKDITNQVKQNNGAAPQGYKGGRTYKNIPLEEGAQMLPEGVNYKEYDVNPYVKGQNRGAERIVIGDDGSVWYTSDHYNSFTRIN